MHAHHAHNACRSLSGFAGSISSKLLQAHLNFLHTHSEGIKGVDGRCLANLTWALAKLDLSSDDNALTTELALMVAPFIIRTLNTSSPQVSAARLPMLVSVWGVDFDVFCWWRLSSPNQMGAYKT